MAHEETTAATTGIAREAKTRRGALYAREAGQGPALLLLHAFPLNSRMWAAQIDALKGRARVVAPDLPGFGLTPAPRETSSLDDYAEAVLDVLEALETKLVREMVERIPEARLVLVPEAGHLTNLEAPAAFNDALASLIVRAGGVG